MSRPTVTGCLKGSTLLFTLIVMVLLGLMGASLMINSRTELTVSHNTYVGREAFSKADFTARLALFLGRALLADSAGWPCEILNDETALGGRKRFSVSIGADVVCSASCRGDGCTDFNLENIKKPAELPTLDDMASRYLQATAAAAAGGAGTPFTIKPNITVRYDGQIVATAALAMYYGDAGGSGGGICDDCGYGNQGENATRVYLVVSADGRLAKPADEANYYSGSAAATHSIVTAVFREIVVN